MHAGSPPGESAAPGPAAALRLEVISGNASGVWITVEDELVIGRLADGEGRLEEDPELSRHHARISRERDGRYAIEDLGSSNGTFVNGLQLSSPAVLLVGDSVELGGTTLVVREITEPPSAATVPGTTEAPTTPDPFRDATVFARVVPDEPTAPAAGPGQATAGPQVVPAEPHGVPAPPPAAPAQPSAPAQPEPVEAADTAPAPAAEPLPPFDVRVSIDAAAGEAHLHVGADEPLRFVLGGDGWTFAGPGAS